MQPTGVTVYGNCEPIYGACCDEVTALCLDGIAQPDCILRFVPDTPCSEIDPPCGARLLRRRNCRSRELVRLDLWRRQRLRPAFFRGPDRARDHPDLRQLAVRSVHRFAGLGHLPFTWAMTAARAPGTTTTGDGAVQSRCAGLAAGTYHATLEAYSSACGPVTLQVVSYEPADRAAESARPSRRRLSNCPREAVEY